MSQWNDLTSIFSFLQYIYAVNRNKFSSFWIYRQKNGLNLSYLLACQTVVLK